MAKKERAVTAHSIAADTMTRQLSGNEPHRAQRKEEAALENLKSAAGAT